jgi:hypothetical protein
MKAKLIKESINNNLELFINALNTLFHAWGSEAPSEVIWGANELLDWYEKEFNVNLNIRFNEEHIDNDFDFNEVIDAIRNS